LAKTPPRETWVWLVEAALAEDLGSGDVTSQALIPADLSSAAHVEVRESSILAGMEVAREVFARKNVAWEPTRLDGDQIEACTRIATVRGPVCGILAAERTALNFLQRLSGIATLTRRFCDAVQGTRATIVDTRKTTPGWRTLEKFAVRCGGGTNHRMGLHDGLLIKDNHIRAIGSVADAVKRLKAHNPSGLRLQAEVESLSQAQEAIEAGADALLLDNQTPSEIAEIVAVTKGRVLLEASGGITLANVAEVARTGVDRISVGALTHSAPAVDIALEWNAPSSI
jgi:nicotinate-nucleotide pyrophosphorylase (carboxylating)